MSMRLHCGLASLPDVYLRANEGGVFSASSDPQCMAARHLRFGLAVFRNQSLKNLAPAGRRQLHKENAS